MNETSEKDMEKLVEYCKRYKEIIDDFNHIIQDHNDDTDQDLIRDKVRRECGSCKW